jgi:hypothetical protein
MLLFDLVPVNPMRWAQRLKRVFGIDVETCAGCGGAMRIIARIEDTVVLKAILAHFVEKTRPPHATRSPPDQPHLALSRGLDARAADRLGQCLSEAAMGKISWLRV